MNFIKSAFCDNDGTANPAHIIAFILVLASVSWVSFLVYKNPHGPIPDLTGIAYLLGGSGAMNICHKADDLLNTFRKGPSTGGI